MAHWMNKFNLEMERHFLLGDCGYAFSLASNIEQSKSVGGRGSSAHAFLGTAIQCLLAGLDEPAYQLLNKAREWVSASLEESEVPKRYLDDKRYSPEGEAALRYQTLALTNWLLDNRHDAERYERFVVCEDHFLKNSKSGKDRVNVSMVLPAYLDAGAYHRGLQLFDSIGFRIPSSYTSIRHEAPMTYILCRHLLGEDFLSTETESLTANFLNRSVENWLINGHFVRVAEWMKITYWNQRKEDRQAKQSLLKCLDHLTE